jgi:hypothetical protein
LFEGAFGLFGRAVDTILVHAAMLLE